jgi:hypothetical protein
VALKEHAFGRSRADGAPVDREENQRAGEAAVLRASRRILRGIGDG